MVLRILENLSSINMVRSFTLSSKLGTMKSSIVDIYSHVIIQST